MSMTDEQKAAWLAQKKALPVDKKIEILEAIIEFTADVGDMTPNEIDEVIREAGLDPEKVGLNILTRLKARFPDDDPQEEPPCKRNQPSRS